MPKKLLGGKYLEFFTMENVFIPAVMYGFSYYLKFVINASIFQNLREGLMLKKNGEIEKNA